MPEVTATTDRVREMLDGSSWDYTVDADTPGTFTLDFETKVREHMRISVIVADDWVVVSHIFGRNPADNEAAVHRRLLELNWILNGCKFAVDEEGDIVLLDEQLASDLDAPELITAIESIAVASEEYYEELLGIGMRS